MKMYFLIISLYHPRLIWFLWRQACRVEPSDPEAVITELEAACTETHLTHQDGAVSVSVCVYGCAFVSVSVCL